MDSSSVSDASKADSHIPTPDLPWNTYLSMPANMEGIVAPKDEITVSQAEYIRSKSFLCPVRPARQPGLVFMVVVEVRGSTEKSVWMWCESLLAFVTNIS